MAISNWSSTASGNGSVLGINIAESCAAANLNNALRETLAQIKTWYAVAQPLIATITAKQASNSTLTALGTAGAAADKLPYYTDGTTAALADFSTFARTLLDDTSATAACNTLGAVRVVAMSLADPGYIKFQVGAAPLYFMLAWGSKTYAPNTTTAVTYAAAFPNASYPFVSAVTSDGGAQDNEPGVVGGSATVNGFTAFCARNGATSGYYMALGY